MGDYYYCGVCDYAGMPAFTGSSEFYTEFIENNNTSFITVILVKDNKLLVIQVLTIHFLLIKEMYLHII